MSSPSQKRKPEKEEEDFPSKRRRATTAMDIDEISSSSEELSPPPAEPVLESSNQSHYETSTSKYDSVYWLQNEGKWVAQLVYRKKAYFIGHFDTEDEAAVAVNLKCQELNIPIRNPRLNGMLLITRPTKNKPEEKENKDEKKSGYLGVSWDKRENKWLARFTYKGKPHFVGYFDDELEAAVAINGRCRYLNIPIKNNDVDETKARKNISEYTKKVARPNSGKTSKYSNVYWEQETKMWHAKLTHNGKLISLGRYRSEIDAAISVNSKCTELGIDLKNPELEGKTVAPRYADQKTSKYRHVNWDRSSKKWRAQMSINGKQTYIGLYQNETTAAMAVNQKCQELGIPVRNPDVDFYPNLTNQITNVSHPTYINHRSDDGKDPENGKVPENGYSSYNGVFWDDANKVWYGKFTYMDEEIHCGYFNSKIDAAYGVNQKCVDIGIPLKNAALGVSTPQFSKYRHVFWDANTKLWGAKFEFKGMMQNIGKFKTEVEAAIAVNRKCEEYGIPPLIQNIKNSDVLFNGNYSNGQFTNGKTDSNGNGQSSNGKHDSNGNGQSLSNGKHSSSNGNEQSVSNGNHSSNGNGQSSNGKHSSNGNDQSLSNGNEKHSSNGNGESSNGNHASNGNVSTNGAYGNGHYASFANSNREYTSFINGNGFSENGTNGSSSSLQNHFGNNDHPQNTSNNSYYDSSENGNDEHDDHQDIWNTLTKELESKNRLIHGKNLQIQDKEKIIARQQIALEESEKIIQAQKEQLAKQNEILKSFE